MIAFLFGHIYFPCVAGIVLVSINQTSPQETHMLISQRIAKDPKFIRAELLTAQERIDFRMKVIQSTKFLVGTHFLTNRHVEQQVMDMFEAAGSMEKMIEKAALAEERNSKYARPPFPLTVLENPDALILVEELTDKSGWSFTRIEADGNHLNAKLTVKYELQDLGDVDLSSVPQDMLRYSRVLRKRLSSDNLGDLEKRMYAIGKTKRGEDADLDAQITEMLEDISGLLTTMLISVSELLTMINVANARIHHYIPTKKELSAVPKPLQSQYSYRLLDLFRERVKYVSLEEMITDVKKSPEETAQRRAHLVRGHYKEKNGQLYWWSAHMRSKNNAQTLGEVKKTYVLYE